MNKKNIVYIPKLLKLVLFKKYDFFCLGIIYKNGEKDQNKIW